MAASTSFHDAIVRTGAAGPEVEALFPAIQKRFLVRQPLNAIKAQFCCRTNEVQQATSQDQRADHADVLVRLPSLRESKWKITVLQQWIGRVEHVEADRFLAAIADATNVQNPPEQVELDLREVSDSDLALLGDGATFYWSIGYRDTPGGQRERISTLRFARQPHLSGTAVTKIFEQADRSAAFLESD